MADLRVLVIDDHPLLRNGVAVVLSAQAGMTVVGEAGNGTQSLEMIQEMEVDLCLVDLRMPGLSGPEFMRQARRLRPGIKFLVLTTYDSEEDICSAFDSGASGYVLKGVPGEQLVDAVRTVGSGGRFIPAAIARRLERRIDAGLTGREMEILRLMVAGLSNREIGARLSITEGTVKWNVNHILSKLGVEDRTQAVTTALRRGLVELPPEPDPNQR